jgi:putative acetyltransferase
VIEIRAERPEDIPFIQQVHQQAFHPRLNEARLVELLRQANKISQSLVAIAQGQVVGHVMFSPITFVPDDPSIHGLGLAPMGVLPEFQRHGIGGKLIVQGLQACKQNGCDLVVVLGDPRYYARFGFLRARNYQLQNEYHVDEEFMVIELRVGALGGVGGLVKYQAEFTEAAC